VTVNNSIEIPFSPKRCPIFYGWIILVAGTLGVLMSLPGQTIGVAAFKEPLIAALGISSNDLALSYMFGTLTSGFLLTYAGKAYDRFGARIISFLACLGLGFTLIVLSKSHLIAGKLSSSIPLFDRTTTIITFMAIAFFFLRFFGQGILTMVSRNMMMKWFDKKRGLVNALSGLVIPLGFSGAPYCFDRMVKSYNWDGAWFITGLICCAGFSTFALLLFRDNPEQCGLLPDGGEDIVSTTDTQPKSQEPDTPLPAVLKSFTFWIFVLTMSMFALFNTAATFHIADIFTSAAMPEKEAFLIFIPGAIIAVAVNFLFGWMSDKVQLKYINMILAASLATSMVGVIFLSPGPAVYAIIAGNGVAGGTFPILISVSWPRFFGRAHLGAISGFSMSALVMASAIGPWMFSISKLNFQSYNHATALLLVLTLGLLICSTKADKPSTSS